MKNSLTASVALIRDTFREAFARKIFWGLFGLSTVMILFFLFLLRIDLVEGGLAAVKMFGQTVSPATDVDRLVRGVYGGIATFLYTWGMFLAVFASAGLIPSVLEPGRIELLFRARIFCWAAMWATCWWFRAILFIWCWASGPSWASRPESGRPCF